MNADSQKPRPDDSPAGTDALLIDGVRQHSELALTALFEQYGGRVLSLAQSFVGDHARAEEVALDVFMRCWNGDEAFESSQGTLHTWLLGVTRRQAVAALEASDMSNTDTVPSHLALTGFSPAAAKPARSLRERLLARARGEEAHPPAVAPLSMPAPATPQQAPSFDPFPEPAAPIPVQARVVEPPPQHRRAALEPIPSTRIPERPRQRRIRLASLGWAAALLFVIASGLFVGAWSVTGPHASPAVELAARLPGGQIRTLTGAGIQTARARLFVFDGGKQAELAVERMLVPPPGRVYQLWFAEPGQPFRTGGTFTVNARGETVAKVTIPATLEQIRGISVTEEPVGGSANPSGAELLSWVP